MATMNPDSVERRVHPDSQLELRTLKNGQGPGQIVGYAAVFDVLSEDLGGWRERIARGAFAGCLADDVRALVNHDPTHLLGRALAGTCRFEEDAMGLVAEIDLPDTTLGRDTATAISRGDMTGMSFSFTVAPDGDEWDFRTPEPVRTVRKVARLYDLGPVTFPAYEATRCDLRSRDRALARWQAEDRATIARCLTLARLRQQLCEMEV